MDAPIKNQDQEACNLQGELGFVNIKKLQLSTWAAGQLLYQPTAGRTLPKCVTKRICPEVLGHPVVRSFLLAEIAPSAAAEAHFSRARYLNCSSRKKRSRYQWRERGFHTGHISREGEKYRCTQGISALYLGTQLERT